MQDKSLRGAADLHLPFIAAWACGVAVLRRKSDEGPKLQVVPVLGGAQ
jgi:hypothetical protein